MSLLNAIRYIPLNQKGNAAVTAQLVDDATMTTQFALLKAGKPGTSGAIDGVQARWGQYGVVDSFDAAGNAIFKFGVALIDEFGSPGGAKNALVSVNLGAPALKDNDIVHAAITLPAANSTTGIHAAITLTADTQSVTTGITNPSGRLPTITGGFAGQVGPVVINGTDLNGDACSVTLMLSGTSTVAATLSQLPNGLDTVTEVVVPPYTNNASDTVAIGYGKLVVIASITDPDFPQCLELVGAEADQTQVIDIYGTDIEDATLTEAITLNGVTPVDGTKAFKTVQSVAVAAQNDAGETVSIGTSNIMGLPYRMDHDALLAAQLGTAHESTRPTVTYDALNVSGNTALLSTALDGAKSITIDFIRCDAPLEFDRL